MSAISSVLTNGPDFSKDKESQRICDIIANYITEYGYLLTINNQLKFYIVQNGQREHDLRLCKSRYEYNCARVGFETPYTVDIIKEILDKEGFTVTKNTSDGVQLDIIFNFK